MAAMTCPACRKSMGVDKRYEGGLIGCPNCGEAVIPLERNRAFREREGEPNARPPAPRGKKAEAEIAWDDENDESKTNEETPVRTETARSERIERRPRVNESAVRRMPFHKSGFSWRIIGIVIVAGVLSLFFIAGIVWLGKKPDGFSHPKWKKQNIDARILSELNPRGPFDKEKYDDSFQLITQARKKLRPLADQELQMLRKTWVDRRAAERAEDEATIAKPLENLTAGDVYILNLWNPEYGSSLWLAIRTLDAASADPRFDAVARAVWSRTPKRGNAELVAKMMFRWALSTETQKTFIESYFLKDGSPDDLTNKQHEFLTLFANTESVESVKNK